MSFVVINEKKVSIENSPVTPERLAGMIGLIGDGTISGKIAKNVFDIMVETGRGAGSYRRGRRPAPDHRPRALLSRRWKKSSLQTPRKRNDTKAGDKKLIGFFVGQVMKATQGKANPQACSRDVEGETVRVRTDRFNGKEKNERIKLWLTPVA